MMKSLTVRLPDVLAQRVEKAALVRGVSKSDIVRQSLDKPGPPPVKEGGMRDILEECWAAKVPAQPRRFGSPKNQKLAEIIRARKMHR
jgi:hypothetical protein